MSISADIQSGRAAARRARSWREAVRHKVKTSDRTRQASIEKLIAQIDEAMKPIRSGIGSLLWHVEYRRHEADLREVSKSLQYERKQLKKMRRR